KRIPCRGILQKNGFSRAEYVLENRLRQVGGCDTLLCQSDRHGITCDRSFCLDAIRIAPRKDQQTSLSTRVFQAQAQGRGDQLLHVGLTRYRLQGLEHDGQLEALERRPRRKNGANALSLTHRGSRARNAAPTGERNDSPPINAAGVERMESSA